MGIYFKNLFQILRYVLSLHILTNYLQQELRKLVRRVHITQERRADKEEEEKKIERATIGAKKALTRFLRGLSKRIPNEY